MPLRPDPLPQDAAQLSRIILSLDAENADLKARVAFLEQQFFGPKSEKMTAIDLTQVTLDLGDLSDIPQAANDDVAPVAEGTTQARRAPSRNIGRLPAHLAQYAEVIEPDRKICPCSSFELHCIGTDVSEALDMVPAVVRIKRMIRPRYACRACESVLVQAPAPARVMDGGMVTTALAATAKLNGLDPEVSLADVLKRIISGKVKANRMESLLPWAWKSEREDIADQERRAA